MPAYMPESVCHQLPGLSIYGVQQVSKIMQQLKRTTAKLPPAFAITVSLALRLHLAFLMSSLQGICFLFPYRHPKIRPAPSTILR
jgi:hypothetical protein